MSLPALGLSRNIEGRGNHLVKARLHAQTVEERIRQDLKADAWLKYDTEHLKIFAESDRLILEGYLKNQDEKDRAEEIASRHFNRSRILNKIEVLDEDFN